MPGFARELSDTQLATLGTFLEQRFGNPIAVITAFLAFMAEIFVLAQRKRRNGESIRSVRP